MRSLSLFVIGLTTLASTVRNQDNFSDNPLDAQFVTTDVDRFWLAFDRMDSLADSGFLDQYLTRVDAITEVEKAGYTGK
ncbi:hypothetical protein [Lewinella sp. IMCC34191]|uniref:hypothetical protein n=1 Tax=Lewinella sp. IMCC34191 TaxID=2259172 RepID=UPI000E247B0E|nr:hypothetical protein [Lewinella sp. IMCC34191]